MSDSNPNPVPPPVAPPVTVAPQVPVEPRPLVPLDRIPTPPIVIGLAALAVVLFFFSLFRFPGVLASGIANEKGRQALLAGRADEAARLLAPVVRKYPKAKETRMNLARAYLASDNLNEAATVLKTFDGEKVSSRENEVLNQLEQELMSKLQAKGQLEPESEGTQP